MENGAFIVIAVLCGLFVLGCVFYYIKMWWASCSRRVAVTLGAHAGFAVDTSNVKGYKNHFDKKISAGVKESRLGKDRSILKSGPYAVV